MYGLMKAHICSRHQGASQPYRLHYCGVCKTMGSLYGQKTRFLLNYDAVFLAELLTALSPDAPPTQDWNASYQSYNCFSLPESAAEMPLPLQVAAAATLLMTEYKVADQITDGGSAKWKLAHKLLASPFETAAAQMEAWGFPLDDIRRWGAMQEAREMEARECPLPRSVTAATTLAANGSAQMTQSEQAVLTEVAEPTAAVTGLVFQHSGAVVGCSQPIQVRLYALGFAFGSLVYGLDALEDYAKDRRQGAFNALQAAFGLWGEALPARCFALTAAYLYELRQDVENELWALPLPPGQAHRFVTRLRANLDARLGEEAALENNMRAAPEPEGDKAYGSAPFLRETIQREQAASRACALPAPRPSLRAQGQMALVHARRLTARYREERAGSVWARLASPGVCGAVWTIALIFPEPVKTATSYEACLDIPRNLMFAGAALRRLAEAAARLLPARPTLALARGTGAGVRMSSEQQADGSTGITHSSSASSVVTVKKRQRPSCCGDCCSGVDCDACCCACQGAECCCDCGDCCGSCGDCGDCCS